MDQMPLAWAVALFLVNQAFFALTFVIVAMTSLRERRRSSLDIALLFGAMAVLLVVSGSAAGLVPQGQRAVLITLLILAVPYFMLRVVSDFSTVPWWALRLAEVVLLAQGAALIAGNVITLPVVAAYAAIPIAWSSVAFVRGAQRARGLTGRRYRAAAFGNGAAVASLVLVIVGALLTGTAIAQAAAIAVQLCVLGAGIGYFVGFAPPRWLRGSWRDAEVRAFLSLAPRVVAEPDSDAVLSALAAGAREALGFDGALIGQLVGPGRLRFVGTGLTYEAAVDETFGGRAMRAGRALLSLDPMRDVPGQAALYLARDAKMIVAAPMRVGDETLGVLTARCSYPSIFTGDELEMCQLLADQAAIVLKSRALMEERERRAGIDEMTGLMHAPVLYRRLERRLGGASERVALVLMDMDAFAEVNQTFGHPVGDQILAQVARRLEAVAPAGSEVARWGGDQFAVLMPAATVAEAEALARRILASLERPCVVGPDEIECGASIGIAVHPDHAADARGLVAAADLALGMAKRTASTAAVYPPEAQLRVHRTALRSDLRRAIADGSIRVEYQPLVSMRSGALMRLEALARWDHPDRGPIPPSEFVDVAERTGLIRPLTERVLRQALADGREWRRWLPRLRVAVNLSARAFAEAGLVDQIAAACTASGCDPAGLSLEITESILMTEPERAHETISRLRSLGVTTEIDDFGTGYSSLSYLQHLPVSGIKIDRRFIVAMAGDERSDAIVRATIRLSHELGFEVVAEGISGRRPWELLAASGCDVGQGFYIGRPMPAEAVRGWVNTWLVRVPAQAASATAEPVERGKGLVLVVDDDPAIVSVIRDVLSESGYAVVTASDGGEALSSVSTRKPDAALLDVHMPLVDGETFAASLRERGIRIPLVVMTAGPNAERWAERLHASAHLAKPFAVEELLAVMGRVTPGGELALQ